MHIHFDIFYFLFLLSKLLIFHFPIVFTHMPSAWYFLVFSSIALCLDQPQASSSSISRPGEMIHEILWVVASFLLEV